MNALIAMAKGPSIVSNAMGQESGLWDFIPATAKTAQVRERALVLSAVGQASFQHRHNQTDPLPKADIAANVVARLRTAMAAHGPSILLPDCCSLTAELPAGHAEVPILSGSANAVGGLTLGKLN